MGLLLAEKINIDDTLYHLERDRCALDLSYFIRKAWPLVEPANKYVEGWHVKLVCEHLEAITNEEIIEGELYNRLLINIPPRTMKTLLSQVFWPAWEWGPRGMQGMRYLLISHKVELPIQWAGKLRRLISSQWYRDRWPVEFLGDQNAKTKYENKNGGFVAAVAAGAVTGLGGDRVILDDAMSWEDAQSDQIRTSTIDWFLGALPTRLNNPDKSAIVVVEQRLHEGDVSGTILDRQLGYDHIRLPMRYDSSFPMPPSKLGIVDPRSVEGELLFPQRFPKQVVDGYSHTMSGYEFAGQMQQVPIPKGGGIVQASWWKLWSDEKYPELDYILASLDTAYGEKQENDYSAMTIWGVYTIANTANVVPTRSLDRYGRSQEVDRVYAEGAPNVIVMYAWRARLPFHELIQRVTKTCRDWKIDRLIIEEKSAGISVLQELRRVNLGEEFGIQGIIPKGDKWQRLHSVSHLWQEGMIHAPDKEWAEMVIREVETFPKGKHDDLVDTVSMAAKFLRDNGLLSRAPERLQEIADSMVFHGSQPTPLYPA